MQKIKAIITIRRERIDSRMGINIIDEAVESVVSPRIMRIERVMMRMWAAIDIEIGTVIIIIQNRMRIISMRRRQSNIIIIIHEKAEDDNLTC